ncbi:MAG: hypothetical protein AAF985_10535 [Bacteroidota bacterium]
MKYGTFVFAMLGLLSCDLSVEPKNQQEKPFFDLLTFFAEEKVKNQKVKSFQKSIRLNDQLEQKQLDSLDLATELALFTKSDINKTAWLDKYEVDSIYGADQSLRQLQYRAKEEKLVTRSITIDLNQQGMIDSLMIINRSASMIAQSSETLKYVPGRGYQIKHLQQVTSQPEHELVVDVRFVY